MGRFNGFESSARNGPWFDATWNLGGVQADGIHPGLQEAERRLGLRLAPGIATSRPWMELLQEGCYSVHSCRDEDAWRGNEVAFRTSEWSLMRKKADSRGARFRLRRLSDGCQVWVGSAHFTQGAAKEVHSAEVHGFLCKLPATAVDANAAVEWGGEADILHAMTGCDSKSDGMLHQFRERDWPSYISYHPWKDGTDAIQATLRAPTSIFQLFGVHCTLV